VYTAGVSITDVSKSECTEWVSQSTVDAKCKSVADRVTGCIGVSMPFI
jgi:hypothetical protein